MSTPVQLLVIVAGLLLLIGVLGVVTITLVAIKCRCKTSIRDEKNEEHADQLDPWAKAAKRHNEEFPEQ